MLAGARVSVYPIDADGVTVNGSETFGIGGPPAISGRFIASETWAESTGGKAYHANDIAHEIADAVDHGSRYYTLAYVPSDRVEDGKERGVEVKVASGDYKLFYRKRYVEQTRREAQKAAAASANRPLNELMGHGMPDASEIPYRLKVVAVDPQPTEGAARAGENAQLDGKLARYTVSFRLQADNLALIADTDGVRRKSLTVSLLVYSQDGTPLNWESRDVSMTIKPEQWARASADGVIFHFEIDAPEGNVYLRTGVYDAAQSKAGTLEIPLSAVVAAQR
jgi:hypothetical protein